jgi:hypothetical protein
MLQMVEEFYRAGRIKNVSIVLNDIFRSGPGYGYGYNYGYGYGYTYTRNNGYYEENPAKVNSQDVLKKHK